MNLAEITRIIENLIKRGVVHSVNPAAGSVRVQIGKLITDDLPYFVSAAGGVSCHRPPSVGESCLVLSPSGETAAGLVLCGLPSAQYPAPSVEESETVTKYPDGACVKYNHQSGKMEISGIKTAEITSGESIKFNCPVVEFTNAVVVGGLLSYQGGMSGTGGAGTIITGPITHEGDFINKGSVASNGVNLSSHTHNGVQAGGDNTGGPQ
ncbi:phage baseplate assembly protein V [Neisseria sp. S1]|uniref:phage baseplate assembly protein V n=1 Tax=Neisseria sp. S1 TaxID=3318354 RepID=UPI003A8BC30B